MADIIITGGKIVTMNPSWEVIEDGGIAIEGSNIVAIGEREAITSNYSAEQMIDATGGLLLPGFVNGHAHAAMTLFRGLGKDYRLQDWLKSLIFPLEKQFVSKPFVKAGTELAMLEMIQGGTTTFVDMYYFEDSVAEVVSKAGMRAILSATVYDAPTPDSHEISEGLSQADTFITSWKRHPLITPAIAPHAIYTSSSETLGHCYQLAREHDVPIVTHLSEAEQEVLDCQSTHGCSPVTYLNQLGFLGSDVIAAHCVWIDDFDIEQLAEKKVGCINCPSSNTMLGSGVAPIIGLLKAGCLVGIGTDGPASNGGSMDILEEATLTARLQKVTHLDPSVLTAKQVVEMLTIGGAKAIHKENEIGSLEVGKKADIVIVGLNAPHSIPFYDIYTHIAYALKSSDVDSVIINGKVIMEKKRVLTIDQSRVIDAAMKMRDGIRSFRET